MITDMFAQTVYLHGTVSDVCVLHVTCNKQHTPSLCLLHTVCTGMEIERPESICLPYGQGQVWVTSGCTAPWTGLASAWGEGCCTPLWLAASVTGQT